MPTIHAMTVDVEDYFHVAAFNRVITPDDWPNWPSRVEANTQRMLELFAQHKIQITFLSSAGWPSATQNWCGKSPRPATKSPLTAIATS
ncbi:MAG: hypothetical protein U1F46_01140 [Marinagarivorans sp.]